MLPYLAAAQSAVLRDRELEALPSADEAANWAHRSLPAKNTLTAAAADLVDAGRRRAHRNPQTRTAAAKMCLRKHQGKRPRLGWAKRIINQIAQPSAYEPNRS